MRHDPLAKFHAVTGRAAAVLATLAQVAERKIELQRQLGELEAKVGAMWLRDQEAHRPALAGLRGQVAALAAREGELLDEHARELRQEQALRSALESRGLL